MLCCMPALFGDAERRADCDSGKRTEDHDRLVAVAAERVSGGREHLGGLVEHARRATFPGQLTADILAGRIEPLRRAVLIRVGAGRLAARHGPPFDEIGEERSALLLPAGFGGRRIVFLGGGCFAYSFRSRTIPKMIPSTTSSRSDVIPRRVSHFRADSISSLICERVSHVISFSVFFVELSSF